jgi:hypothetical protein
MSGTQGMRLGTAEKVGHGRFYLTLTWRTTLPGMCQMVPPRHVSALCVSLGRERSRVWLSCYFVEAAHYYSHMSFTVSITA